MFLSVNATELRAVYSSGSVNATMLWSQSIYAIAPNTTSGLQRGVLSTADGHLYLDGCGGVCVLQASTGAFVTAIPLPLAEGATVNGIVIGGSLMLYVTAGNQLFAVGTNQL